jgi:YHS domain-containing protein
MRLIVLNLFRLILLLIVVAAIRALIGYAARAFQRVGPKAGAANPSAEAGRTGGELKKDPVCGIFVSAGSSVKKSIDGEVVHFCSAACRDKFRQA